jgi:two-component system response regulator (stage 0 sporulation protein F)
MPSILVADDEVDVRQFLRTVLQAAGHRVWEARNGKEAVALVGRTQVDLVLIDLVMPEQEALETIRLLKKAYPELKTIAMSGDFGERLETMLRIAQSFGAKAGLAKPFSAGAVLETVQRVLDAK